MFEKSNPEYWREIGEAFKKGKTVIIRLTDEQSLEEVSSRGGGLEGLDLKVKSFRHFTEESNLAEYLLFELLDEGTDEPDDLRLVIKIVDQTVDRRIHFIDDEFDPRTRSEVLNDGESWLFDDDDIEDMEEGEILKSELAYVDEIQQDVEDNDGNTQTYMFEQKDYGSLHGSSTIHPPESGMPEEEFTMITEYTCVDEIDNPELMVVELGDDDENGGVITLMPGTTLNETEVDVLIS